MEKRKRYILIAFIILQVIFIYYVIIMAIFYGPNNFKLSQKDGELLYSVDVEKCSQNNLDNYTMKLCGELISSNSLIAGFSKDILGKEIRGIGTQRIDEYKITGGCYPCWFKSYLWIKSGPNYYPTYLYIPSVISSKFQSIKLWQGFYGTQFKFFGNPGISFGINNIILIIINIGFSYKIIKYLKKK